ncbi:GFA family protein [Nitrogeniibacter mangrovi]|uniref:GFA family protein n=2 Tax=Nitrogeniibacter mangrovi TaxID=2016596 RepID=A0A6C1BAE6_9RHOO|nr:GFA family protein [Nitrogeniibacter mangrovi]
MPTGVGACHCGMCRRWGGGPLMVVNCGDQVVFSGQDHIGIYTSSAWAERGFCTTCGTHLFYRLKQNNAYFVPVGLFDTAAALHFDNQVFIDEKPAYYAFANDTGTLTGAEVFALFAGDP